MTPTKKRTLVAFLVVLSAALPLGLYPPDKHPNSPLVYAVWTYFAFALGGGFWYAVRTRCPHCQRRFAENYFFARMAILLWAAKDKCPFCGHEV